MFTTLFVQPLFNVLFAIYGYLPGHDFGLAVILMTLLVRAILWPLVTKQLHSQKLTQSLAPDVARIKEESKGDSQLQTKMLMELYKEKKTSPFAPILPLLIQLPIFFALYIVFRDAVHPDKIAGLAYDAVEHIPQVASVIMHPQSFNASLFGLANLTKPNVFIALAAGLAQFLQTKMMQPKEKPKDDQARILQNVVLIFPVLTVVIGLSLPSALALYWTVTSIVAALQQRLVLRHDAEEITESSDVTKIDEGGVATLKPIMATSGTKKRSGSKKKGKR